MGASGFSSPPKQGELKTVIALRKPSPSAGTEPSKLTSNGKHAKHYIIEDDVDLYGSSWRRVKSELETSKSFHVFPYVRYEDTQSAIVRTCRFWNSLYEQATRNRKETLTKYFLSSLVTQSEI
jgi:hypothetical protein